MSTTTATVAPSGAPAKRLTVPQKPKGTRSLVPAALALLAVAWFCEVGSQLSLQKAQATFQQAEHRLARARALDEQSKRQVDFANFAKDFVARSSALGLIPANWAEQAITVNQNPMTRSDTVSLMSQAQTSAVRVFGADEFDLSPISPGDGLFAPTARAKEELFVTLRGRAAFRVQ